MIKAVLFDIDGTLLDTNEFIYSAYEYTLAKYKYPDVSRQSLAKLMGGRLESIYSFIAPECQTEKLTRTHKQFQKENLQLSKPFSDTLITLKHLQEAKIKIGAITNRSNETSIKTLKLAGIFPLIDLTLSSEDVLHQKPNPEIILKALKYFNISTNNVVIVGDTESDILAGKNAGIITIGAVYGMLGSDIVNLKPDFLIYEVSEVRLIINRFN